MISRTFTKKEILPYRPVIKMKPTVTGCGFAVITGSLLFTVITVNGNHHPVPTRNCQQYRGRDGQLEITRNDDSVYCLQQHLYQSALISSPSNAPKIYVRALLRKALSRCDSDGSTYGSPKSIKKKCKKRKCSRRKLYRTHGKSYAKERKSYRKRKYRGRKTKCSWERKEVRMMSRSEWKRFTNRLNILKRPIKLDGGGSFSPYDVISDIHRDDANLDAAHEGPSFLGWHRVYILILEAALGVPIPYWDSRLDADMTEPTHSILWTNTFFGPGVGIVDSGPFAGWITPDNELLARNIGSRGCLIHAAMVEDILSYRSHYPIVEKTEGTVSIEHVHNGPHNWVGGLLSSLQTSPQEPVFFLHHSFVDYIWYLFRENMRNNGNINPSTDYPNKGPSSHRRYAKMIPFPFRNIEGYGDLIESLTRYQASPTCPDCGRSMYLECDKVIYRCKSKANPTLDKAIQYRRRMAIGTIRLGTKFITPLCHTPTRGDVLNILPLLNRTLLF